MVFILEFFIFCLFKVQVRKISIFGSTGSIGTNTLAVLDNLTVNGYQLEVAYLSANKNINRLAVQAKKYRPKAIVIEDETAFREFRRQYSLPGTEVLFGRSELNNLASGGEYDVAVSSMVGFSGLEPTLSALKAGKEVALANKETLVSAGHIVESAISMYGSKLHPIDSEHSAILQCIIGEDASSISKVVLTASGGPFLNSSYEEMKNTDIGSALNHPNWKMGPKITIDSATLMNKGLEVIEAKWLYSLDHSRIEVIIHPQSIVHSFVEFIDGSVKAQLGVPDMKIPIQYALTYPERAPSDYPRLDFSALSRLDFVQPDTDKFKCLKMAYEVLEKGMSYPAVLNSANEAAVNLFLNGKIGFLDIAGIIDMALQSHDAIELNDAEGIIELDRSVNAMICSAYGAKST